MKPMHAGHRERLRTRFLREDLTHFEDHQVLELLLFYALPRVDTNPIAHRLLARFGTLSGVFNASVEELQKVEGIGENAATLLHLLPSLCRRYLADLNSDLIQLSTVEDAGRYLTSRLIGRPNEVMLLLCLDGKDRIISCEELAEGTVDRVSVTLRAIVELAVRHHAVSVLLAHSHAQGFALPSAADIHMTLQLKNALDSIGILLKDHIIVSNDDFISLAASGHLSGWQNRQERRE